jgi:hypothetical protein
MIVLRLNLFAIEMIVLRLNEGQNEMLFVFSCEYVFC